MENEHLEIQKKKMDLVADLSLDNLISAINLFNGHKKYCETYRNRPEVKERLNEYAKNKMRELRAKRKAEKQAQQI
jgi:hypothetical protein